MQQIVNISHLRIQSELHCKKVKIVAIEFQTIRVVLMLEQTYLTGLLEIAATIFSNKANESPELCLTTNSHSIFKPETIVEFCVRQLVGRT